MPSHAHHAVRHDLCAFCRSASARPNSTLCMTCESELYPERTAKRHPPNRRTGGDRRKRSVPVAVNLREFDRRGFLETVEADEHRA